MSRLSFHPVLHSSEVGVVPVEVHAEDLGLVGRSLSSEELEVEPGAYHVSARLPAGPELCGYVEVSAGETASVDLLLDPADESPSEAQELQRFVWGYEPPSPWEGLAALEAVTGKRSRLLAYTGNPLRAGSGYRRAGGEREWIRPQPYRNSPEVIELSVDPHGVELVQLWQDGQPAVNAVLPSDRGRRTRYPYRLILRPRGDGSVMMAVHPSHTVADTLLGYGQHNLVAEAASVASGEPLDAERLLREKMADPVAAAVGGYFLLRSGELDRLHDWTKNLADWFPWLPDGAVIRAEHLALLGRPKEALGSLVELERRGLPLFTDGLTYAIKRLRLYTASPERARTGGRLKGAAQLLERLSDYAVHVDFSQPTVTFRGSDPNRPGATSERRTAPRGYDVGPLLEEARRSLEVAAREQDPA